MAVASKRVRGARFVATQFRATAMQAALVRQLTETVPWPDTSPVSRSQCETTTVRFPHLRTVDMIGGCGVRKPVG
jgi:hypothetical protein